MFSSKSEELIRGVKRAAIANRKWQFLKPADNRYSKEQVVAHNGSAVSVFHESPRDIRRFDGPSM